MFAHATGEIKGKTPHTAEAVFGLHCLAATPSALSQPAFAISGWYQPGPWSVPLQWR